MSKRVQKVFIGGAVLGCLVFPIDSFAQSGVGNTPPANSCMRGAARVSDAAIKAFLSNPDGLLARHPVGGLPMVTEVRNIISTDTSTAEPMAKLSEKGNTGQKAAIGAGSAQAVQVCARERPDLATLLQTIFGQVSDKEFLAAFLSSVNSFESAAIGATGGAVGGALGGAIGGGGGGGGGSGSGGGSFVTGNSGAGGYSAGGGGSSYTDSRSVSRTR